MATTFNVISLGVQTLIDPTEGNTTAENASSLVGLTFGDVRDPLWENVQSFSPGTNSYGRGTNDAYDMNNNAASENFRINHLQRHNYLYRRHHRADHCRYFSGHQRQHLSGPRILGQQRPDGVASETDPVAETEQPGGNELFRFDRIPANHELHGLFRRRHADPHTGRRPRRGNPQRG